MGIGVVIHGFIEAPGYGLQENCQRIHQHNAAIIDSLPESDNDWPFFPRSMFSLPPLRTDMSLCVPQYENQTIQFIGDFKNTYFLDTEWIQKFEKLLGRLVWTSAVAYCEFSNLRYEWEVQLDHFQDLYTAEEVCPPRKWTLKVVKISEESISLKDGVDGGYKPVRPDAG